MSGGPDDKAALLHELLETDLPRTEEIARRVLARNGLVNGYDHYLWRGNAEGRTGHPLFDPAIYCAGLDPAAADAASADGPFWHCLRRLHDGMPPQLQEHS